ncbi:MAG: EutN/CcmL family microcompartment protein [Candidatus Cloacimonetes bacterium]|nr:EutN/CcmL family microcompartment protein [Candidatus Cloacimonadota bacterium]
MKLGRIEGTVVCTIKDDRLKGLKLLVVHECDVHLEPTNAFHVAADTVQAGPGDLIMFASGSSARQTEKTHGKAIDCAIVAIVDSVNLV